MIVDCSRKRGRVESSIGKHKHAPFHWVTVKRESVSYIREKYSKKENKLGRREDQNMVYKQLVPFRIVRWKWSHEASELHYDMQII